MSSRNKVRVSVEWKNADYFTISRHLETIFRKSFSGSGMAIGTGAGDASFYVGINQADSFVSLLSDEMEDLRNTHTRLKYSVNKDSNVD